MTSKSCIFKKIMLPGVAGLLLAGAAQAAELSIPDVTPDTSSAALVIADPVGFPSVGGPDLKSAQVPEPATVALAGIGIVSLLAFRRKQA